MTNAALGEVVLLLTRLVEFSYTLSMESTKLKNNVEGHR